MTAQESFQSCSINKCQRKRMGPCSVASWVRQSIMGFFIFLSFCVSFSHFSLDYFIRLNDQDSSGSLVRLFSIIYLCLLHKKKSLFMLRLGKIIDLMKSGSSYEFRTPHFGRLYVVVVEYIYIVGAELELLLCQRISNKLNHLNLFSSEPVGNLFFRLFLNW